MLNDLFLNIGHWILDLITGFGVSPVHADYILKGINGVAIILFLVLNAMILIYLERKISGAIQERLGPNRVGPAGIFQLIMDVLKLLGKNSFVPDRVDRFIYMLVPLLSFIPALLLFMILPYGDGMTVYDSPVGLLLYFAISSLMTLLLLMSGWAGNNKYSLIGGMRAVVQMISYEIPLLLSILGIVMVVGSLNLNAIVYNQIEHGWFIWRQPLAFILFLIASTAEINRSPFDLPEGEQELTAGYQTEYSGLRFAFMYLAEYLALLAMSWLLAVLFLGGWQGPILPGWLWMYLKAYLFVAINMWIRWTFPRIRIDHLMSFNWKVLIPLSLANIVLVGTIYQVMQMLS